MHPYNEADHYLYLYNDYSLQNISKYVLLFKSHKANVGDLVPVLWMSKLRLKELKQSVCSVSIHYQIN